jgi:hypothetical protein
MKSPEEPEADDEIGEIDAQALAAIIDRFYPHWSPEEIFAMVLEILTPMPPGETYSEDRQPVGTICRQLRNSCL